MTKRLIIPVLMLLTLLAGCDSGESKHYVWSRFDSTVQVTQNGALDVTENVALRYTGGPFTFVYRDLPQRRLDRISGISVRGDDRVFTQVDDEDSDTPYTFSVFDHEGDTRIRWVYPPTSDTERTFTIQYSVAGAVRRGAEQDEVWWALVPANRDVAVQRSQSEIMLPQAVGVQSISATAPDVAGEVTVEPNGARVVATNIAPGDELTLRVQFPSNVVGGAVPAWQAADARQQEYNQTTRPTVNLMVSALAAGLAVVLGFIIMAWWRRNRDPQGRGFAGQELPGRPGDLAPAAAASLLGGDAGTALVATLLDLAQRGYVTLHEVERSSRWSQPKVLARRTSKATADLAEYERITLEAVFGAAAEVDLSEQQSSIVKATGPAQQAAQRELMQRGYVTAAGLHTRRRGIISGVSLLIIGGAALIPAFILAERYSWWLPVAAGVLALAGLIWLILALTVRGYTAEGADAATRWRAFGRYLKRISPDRAPNGEFDQLLPYATAIANQQKFVKTYSATPEPLPAWYYPVLFGSGHSGGSGAGSAGGTLMLSDWSQNFLSSLSSTSTSTGASSAGGAGGGASGGGGAGAG